MLFVFAHKDSFSNQYRINNEVLTNLFKINLPYGIKIDSTSLHGSNIYYSLAIFSTDKKKAIDIAKVLTESIIADEIEKGCLELLKWKVKYSDIFILDYIILDP